MGGQVRLVHVTTLNGVSLAWFLAASAWGGLPLFLGVPAPFVYPLAHPRGALTLLLSPLLLPCVSPFSACRVVMHRS